MGDLGILLVVCSALIITNVMTWLLIGENYRQQRKLVETLINQVKNREQLISELTNKLLSKDPMTYQALQAMQPDTGVAYDYYPKDDLSELAQWTELSKQRLDDVDTDALRSLRGEPS